MVIFWLKPWVNPFVKKSILGLFERLVFIVLKGDFWFYNIVTDISLPILPKKKMLEKWPFLDQQPWVNPFGKYHFFDFLNILFL